METLHKMNTVELLNASTHKSKGMVKNLAFIFFFLLMGLVILSSCKKLETVPAYTVTEDLVWDNLDSNATLTTWYVNEIYRYLPDGFNRINGDYLDAASGDAVPSRNNTVIEYYTNGRVSVLNNPDPYWGDSYAAIRKVNILLANINRSAVKLENGVDPRQYLKAESRFVRAMAYFEMLKRYGGVPLVGDKVFTLEDNLQIPRNNFGDCVDYIVKECDAIKDSLRKEIISDNNWGRIPRGAAIALKCRTLLYAASPLFNGGGIETDPAKKTLTGYLTADPSRWDKVILAAEEFNAAPVNYGLQASYASVFTTKKNTEIILAKQRGNTFDIESNNAPVGYGSPAASQGRTSPTQDFVDAFPMANGLMPAELGSGYLITNPYANRDPRLGAIVFYNGVRWLSRNIQTYEGGLDKPNSAAVTVQTKTSYYLRKFMADFSNNTTYTNQSHNFPIFRYAEIVLNYAEALNEANRTPEAIAQIILIRKRAGIAAGTNLRYGIKTPISQAEARDLIRNERRIELSFEDHRFWDIRRWKIANQVLNAPVYGMQITNGTALVYQKVQIGALTFKDRLYHMPLPYGEIVKNSALVQNEGW